MKTWLKYAVSFFALVLVLAGFVYAFGPASTRQAARSGEMQTGQLNSNAQLTTPGEPINTQSGTTLPADAPMGDLKAAPVAPDLTNGPNANPVVQPKEATTPQ